MQLASKSASASYYLIIFGRFTCTMTKQEYSINQYFFIIAFLLIAVSGISQNHVLLSGKVYESENGTPLPFANVFVKNNYNGTVTDTDGHFQLRADLKKDTIVFRLIGYEEKQFPAGQLMSDSMVVWLSPSAFGLMEVVVTPTDEALRLAKKVIGHKHRNNPVRYNIMRYQKYSKWDFSLNNINDKLMESWLFKEGQNLIRHSEDSTRYLPFFFSEQVTDNEIQNHPSRQKSTIIADQTKGVNILKHYEISGYSSALDMGLNFYDNVVLVFNQGFISPIADNGPFYYKYYLTDSIETNKGKEYVLKFVPKRSSDKTFAGYMTVETHHHAMLKIDATLSAKSNVNFIKKLSLSSEYQLINDSLLFFKSNEIRATVDYVPVKTSKKHLELNYLTTNSVKNIDLSNETPVELSVASLSFETIKTPNNTKRDSIFWSAHRPEPLNAKELDTTNSIDSLNLLGSVHFIDNLTHMFINGHYNLGRFEIGPYMEAISFNKVEGLHLFAGGRTSKTWSEWWQLSAGIGYGTKTEKISGSFGVGHRFDTRFRNVARVSYADKIVRIGESENILYLYENMLTTSESNLVAMLLQRAETDELVRRQTIQAGFEHEWRTGLESHLKLFHSIYDTPVYYPFMHNGQPIKNTFQTEVSIDTRWSWKQKYVEEGLDRLYFRSQYPILHLTLAGGEAGTEYHKQWYGRVHATLKHSFFVGMGEIQYAVESGAYVGELPWNLLNIPRGNKTYGLYTYDFNMLDYLEFVNDKYLTLYIDYHLNGFIFNRVPLLNRLGLREVVAAKAMIGGLSERHNKMIDINAQVQPLDGAYVELNAGVENILRFLRIDAVWRVTPSSKTGAPHFGLRAQFAVKF